MSEFERLIPFVIFIGYIVVAAAVARARLRRAKRAMAVSTPVVPPASTPNSGAQRRTLPVARLPVRAEVPPPPAPAATPPPASGNPLRSAGPRWAANAIIAAEVFGPPVASRPGGTLGPPNAL